MTEQNKRSRTSEEKTKMEGYWKYLKSPPVHFVLPGWLALAFVVVGWLVQFHTGYRYYGESLPSIKNLHVLYIIYGSWIALFGFGLAYGAISGAQNADEKENSDSGLRERDSKAKRYWSYLTYPPRLRLLLPGWWALGLIVAGVLLSLFPYKRTPDPPGELLDWLAGVWGFFWLCGMGLRKGYHSISSGTDDEKSSHWLWRFLHTPLFGGAENTDQDESCN